MRLENYLSELAMKKGTVINVVTATPKNYLVKITLEGGELFTFEAAEQDDKYAKTWTIAFEDSSGSLHVSPKDKGVALQLFAALEMVFINFIKKYKPDDFEFSGYSHEKSKIKLYGTVAKKIAKRAKYFMQSQTAGDQTLWIFNKTRADEAQVISLLSKKIKMLKKKHGQVSKSMLTKKEWDQFTKDKK